jgi:protocatechuate 3,4-dioxygenase beta subunit
MQRARIVRFSVAMKEGDMRRFTRFSIPPSIALLFVISVAGAQTPQGDNRPRTVSIGGRVTVGGSPAANALVMVAEVDPRSRTTWPASPNNESQQRAFIKVRTDGDGRYQVAGLTGGAYMIRALSKAYTVSKNSSDSGAFRSVTLDDGESRDGVDIALVRGGVITGRVMDAEDRPLIGARLQPLFLDEKGNPRVQGGYQPGWYTDDRGVYRIYGLPAGRYILSAAIYEGRGSATHRLPQTFYPGATDQKQAKIIEVKESAEVADIDIRFGAAKNTYEATGRVIDAETGRPLPGVWVACMEAPGNGNGGGRSGSGAQTDDEGEFSLFGLSSGRYELWLESQQMNGEHYSEKTLFEVDDSDVKGLEVKAIRGSTVSGVVVIEGAGDPSIRSKLSQIVVMVDITRRRESVEGGGAYDSAGSRRAKVAGNGGFQLTGVTPGMATFSIWSSQENAFLIKRIERDGAEIKNAFEIGRGEQVTGLRIVAVQSNGTIRGQVEIAGGKLPEGWELSVWAAPTEMAPRNDFAPAFYSNINGYAAPDEKGRFVIEKLAPGEYELRLNVMVRARPGESRAVEGLDQIKQRVTVMSGVETPAKLTLDLSRKQ